MSSAACLCGLLVLGWTAPAAAQAPDRPRPLSDAERQAVELAGVYLSEGGEAWQARLDPTSPWSGLDPADATAELEARLGPADGAIWILRTPFGRRADEPPEDLAVFTLLYPSGVDETLVLRLTGGGDDWSIREVRVLSEERGAPTRARRTSVPVSTGPAVPAPSVPAWAFFALLAGLAAVVSLPVAAPGGRRRWAVAAVLGVLVAGCTGLIVGCGGEDAAQSVGEVVGEASVERPDGRVSGRQPRLGSLRDLRRSMALEGDPAVLAAALAGDELTGATRSVAELWRAQLLMRQVDLDGADRALAALEPGRFPLADLLGARLATIRGDSSAALWGYEEVRSTGIDHGGLGLEMVQSLATLGLTPESEKETERMVFDGARDADIWYSWARLRLLSGQEDEATAALEIAWAEQPMLRQAVFGDPIFAYLIARPELFSLIDPSSPEEPVIEAADLGRRSVPLPLGAEAETLGRRLEIRLADDGGQIHVPGGSAVAPTGVVVGDADRWREREEAAALDWFERRFDAGEELVPGGRPWLQRELLTAVSALAAAERWDELVGLTEGLTRMAEAPEDLVHYRALALRRLGRRSEARELLIRLARTALESRRPTPLVLYQLAETFVADREYDTALRLFQRAAAVSPQMRNETRLEQVRLERWLFEDHERHWTDHFEVVYPSSSGWRYAEELGVVLEAERRRISRWVPLGTGSPIEINLLPLERFFRAYSTNVLGLYDGRVRVPFADLQSLDPEVLAILSHEVAHALIGQATHDRAPAWFQEGMAQHIEMTAGRLNPIPDLHRNGRVIAFPLIDPILDGFASPELTDLAYGEAVWVVHYLETKHGIRSLHELTRAFARGASTEEAIRSVLGMSLVEFDRAVWRWCLDEAPGAWTPPELVRYDRQLRDRGQVRRSASASFDSGASPRASGRRSPSGGGPASPLATWFAHYTETSAALDRSLDRVRAPIRAGHLPQSFACASLEGRVSTVRRDPTALRSPDPQIAAKLSAAYEGYALLARACRQQDVAVTQQALALAEQAIAEAEQLMRRRGLNP